MGESKQMRLFNIHVVGIKSNFFGQLMEGDSVIIENEGTKEDIKAGYPKIPFILRFERCDVTNATEVRIVLNPAKMAPVKAVNLLPVVKEGEL